MDKEKTKEYYQAKKWRVTCKQKEAARKKIWLEGWLDYYK